MSCDKTIACFTDERIAKYFFNKCLPNRIEIILFLATLSFTRETLGRVNHVLQLKWQLQFVHCQEWIQDAPYASELFRIKFYQYVCLCTRLKFSAHASVFCFCLLLEWKECAYTKVQADKEKKTCMRVQRVTYTTYCVI